ncbi:hypothetical protein HHI36_016615 [Cryptolaemus montrouzieri]|uniref:Uncharacterized protein n=1 Tax=Cryptolaemus montrouzieri TaxID=559131 RepID=A0ABD2NL35_9CUCU
MDNNRKHLKALHDSGLTKNTPKNGTSSPIRRENPDKILNSCINLKESSLRKQIKAAILSECKLKPLFSTESLLKPPSKPLPDPNKVNELDCLNNRNQSRPYPLGKTFFSQLIRTQFRFSSRKTTRNNCRDKTPPIKRKRKKSLSDSEDEVISDIKSIANCLLENTLNKLNIKESSRLIFDHLDDPVVETPPNGSQGSSNFEILTAPAPSTSSSQEQKFMEIIKNKQLGSLRNSPDSGSESNTESQDTIESSHSGKVINGFLESSREALFDPTSQVDLLEDFEIPPVLEEFEIVENVSVVAETNNVVLIGVNLLNENDAVNLDNENDQSYQ